MILVETQMPYDAMFGAPDAPAPMATHRDEGDVPADYASTMETG